MNNVNIKALLDLQTYLATLLESSWTAISGLYSQALEISIANTTLAALLESSWTTICGLFSQALQLTVADITLFASNIVNGLYAFYQQALGLSPAHLIQVYEMACATAAPYIQMIPTFLLDTVVPFLIANPHIVIIAMVLLYIGHKEISNILFIAISAVTFNPIWACMKLIGHIILNVVKLPYNILKSSLNMVGQDLLKKQYMQTFSASNLFHAVLFQLPARIIFLTLKLPGNVVLEILKLPYNIVSEILNIIGHDLITKPATGLFMNSMILTGKVLKLPADLLLPKKYHTVNGEKVTYKKYDPTNQESDGFTFL